MRELKIDITAEANDYLKSLASQLVEEVKIQLNERKRYLTISEVCNEFSCSRNTINSWVTEHGLKRIIIGSKIYIDITDLHKLFSQLKN